MLHPRKKIAVPEKKDYVVTLALESKATLESEFFNDEIPAVCHDCPLYQICMKNLVPGRHYIIKEINDSVRHCDFSRKLLHELLRDGFNPRH